MYCHIHHCHYHHCHCVPKDSKEKGGALTQEELLALTEEMKDELKDYTVDLKDQIFSYIDIGVNPVEIVNTFASLQEQDTYILRTLTNKIDELNNTTNLSMFNLRARVTDLEGQSATIIQDLTDRTDRIVELENNFSSLPFEDGVLADTFVTVIPKFEGAITRNQAEKNLENITLSDFLPSGSLVFTDALNATLRASSVAKLPSMQLNDEYACGSVTELYHGMKIQGRGAEITNFKLLPNSIFVYSNDTQQKHLKLSDMTVIGDAAQGGYSTAGRDAATTIFYKRSGDTTSSTRETFDNLVLRKHKTGIELSSGWNQHINQVEILESQTGFKTTKKQAEPNWATSGFSMTNSYIASCNTAIDDRDAWCATYQNVVVEHSDKPYVQNAYGTPSVWINPWFENNKTAPEWRRNSIVLGGRGHDFSDVMMSRSEDCLTYLSQGIEVIQASFTDSNTGRVYDIRPFKVDGEGVKRFKPHFDSLGWDMVKYSSTDLAGSNPDAVYLKTKVGRGVIGEYIGESTVRSAITGIYAKLQRWSGREDYPKLGVELQGWVNDHGTGRSFNEVAFKTGKVYYRESDAEENDYGTRWLIDWKGTLLPASDIKYEIGAASARIKNIYAETDVITTSDERLKTSLLDLDEAEKNCALEVKKAIKKFKYLSSVGDKGDNARIHFGVGAQTVKAIFEKHGLVAEDYALFCRDTWRELGGKVIGEFEEGYDDAEEVYRLGVRYDELAMFILASI